MKTSILLVEDEIDLGNVVKQYLEIMDFEVDWKLNGKLALEHFILHKNKYDILLIDVSMPEMDGFELASHILKINKRTPFLFLTARNEKKDRLHGLKIGADDYISKPFDVDELVLRIKNIIKGSAPFKRAFREMKLYRETYKNSKWRNKILFKFIWYRIICLNTCSTFTKKYY